MSRELAVSYRLSVNNVSRRLPEGSYVEAAYVGLQDTAPPDALLGMRARVEACEPSAWEDPALLQTYSPRTAVYVLTVRSAAHRLYEEHGFAVEGRYRDELLIDGQYVDDLTMAKILRP